MIFFPPLQFLITRETKSLKKKFSIERSKIKAIKIKPLEIPHLGWSIAKCLQTHVDFLMQTYIYIFFFNKDGLALCIPCATIECGFLSVSINPRHWQQLVFYCRSESQFIYPICCCGIFRLIDLGRLR